MTFHDPQFLWLLCALPLVALLRGRRGPSAAVRFSSLAAAREAAKHPRSRFGVPLLALPLMAAAAFIVALARPQLIEKTSRVRASGIDLVLAVDVSGSMEARDMTAGGKPSSRLAAVKGVVQRFIQDRPNDRIGLIAFAGAPYLVSPPTLDHDWLLKNLERLHTGMVEDGTAIGSALSASVNRLRHEAAKSKTVILLTDGVNNAGKIQPSLAAKAAAAQGVKVYTIGVGSEGQALVPVTDEHGRTRMAMAQVDVDEPTLRQIASLTSGSFFRATDTESLQKVYADIDAMEKTTRSIDVEAKQHERFQWPALFGLAVLSLHLLGGMVLRPRVP